MILAQETTSTISTVTALALLAGGTVGWTVRALLTGRIWAGRVVNQLLADKDAQIQRAKEEAEHWRTAAEAADKQITTLLEVGKTVDQVLHALRETVSRRERGA